MSLEAGFAVEEGVQPKPAVGGLCGIGRVPLNFVSIATTFMAYALKGTIRLQLSIATGCAKCDVACAIFYVNAAVVSRFEKLYYRIAVEGGLVGREHLASREAWCPTGVLQ